MNFGSKFGLRCQLWPKSVTYAGYLHLSVSTCSSIFGKINNILSRTYVQINPKHGNKSCHKTRQTSWEEGPKLQKHLSERTEGRAMPI